MKKISLLFNAAVMALMASSAQSAVTIDVTQSTAGVTFDVSGSIDPSSFTFLGNGSIPIKNIASGVGQVYITDGATDVYAMPAYNLQAFGTGYPINATSSSGTFALVSNGQYNNLLYLPQGYVAGNALSASMFFSGATFASLLINPTDFSENLGSGQIVNFVFKTAVPAVPEPASWALMIGGLGLVGMAMRRRSTVVSLA